MKSLGAVPWGMVYDFDPQSEADGLLSVVRSEIELERKQHSVVCGDRPALNPDKATYWFFAKGLKGRNDSLISDSWRDWLKKYGTEINTQFTRYNTVISPSPVTCVVLWFGEISNSYLDSTLQAAQVAFGDAVNFIILSNQADNLLLLADKYEALSLDIPLHHLCAGLHSFFSSITATGERQEHSIPSSSGAPLVLKTSDENWLSEELEILHLSSGVVPPVDRQIGREFLCGAEIVWYELNRHDDVDRDKTTTIRRQVENDLKNKPSVRVNLYHAPGAGGTTVARRVLWDLHTIFPCAILQRCEPQLTVERLRWLASMTGQPILLLVDSSNIVERVVDELFEALRSRQVAVVLFQILRRFKPQKERARAFYLSAPLSSRESQMFVDKLGQVEPLKKRQLVQLADSGSRGGTTAFHFALEAFGRDFQGITPYVEARLSELSVQQNKILGFLALAHHYTQRPINAQAFAGYLGFNPNRLVDLHRLLTPEAMDLLVQTDKGYWRTAHNLIAEEILQQLLSRGMMDRRNWRQNLSDWAIEFAEFCRDGEVNYSGEMLEITRRAFTYRDNSDVLGTERSALKTYAQLIEEIPVREGKLRVLEIVAELYPREAHFRAHVGRFYANEMEDFAKALECNDQAIQIQGDDHVLHHMRGMTLRRQIYKMMEVNRTRDQSDNLSKVVLLCKSASESFQEARKLNPEDEHAYISEAQLIIKVLDYAGRGIKGGAIRYVQQANVDPYLREGIEHVEDLLEHIRRNHEGEGENPFEAGCRAQLNAIYGQHYEALQVWNSLLERKDTFHPPLRRQIVWTYLARHNRSWDALDPREIDRAVELLEANLQEEPRNDKNLRLWVQAVRRSRRTPSIETVIERVVTWRANSGALDSSYYLYVFYTLLSFSGSALAREEALRYREECSGMARYRRNRTRSHEWIGHEQGLKALVHHSELGEWLKEEDFWEHARPLKRVRGRISRIDDYQKGQIELEDNGLFAFFVPGRSGHRKDFSESQAVDFYLGFSYDGLRAWEVRDIA